MNKRKIEKLLKDNMNISNNFDEINSQIDYSQYSPKNKKTNKFIKLLTNKKALAIVSSVIVLAIVIPLLNPFNSPNSSVSKEEQMSNSHQNNYSGIVMSSNLSMVESSTNVSSLVGAVSSPNSGGTIYNLIVISVDGVVKNDENNNKKFYTDSYYENSISIENAGYYELKNTTIKNFKLVDNELMYSSGNEMLGIDLPINTRCHCKVIIDIIGNTDEYEVRDVYSIEYLIF